MSKFFQLLNFLAFIFAVHSLYSTESTFAERGVSAFNEFRARARNSMPDSCVDVTDKARKRVENFVEGSNKKSQKAFGRVLQYADSARDSTKFQVQKLFLNKPIIKGGALASTGVGGCIAFSYYGRKYGWNLSDHELDIAELVSTSAKSQDIDYVRRFIQKKGHNDYYYREHLLQNALETENVGMIAALLESKYPEENPKYLRFLAYELCDLGMAKKVAWHPEARRRRAWLSGWMLPDRLGYKMD